MKKNIIFPSIVLVCSTLEIVQSMVSTFNWLSFANALLGFVGVTLFFLKNEKYRDLINSWIFLQAIVISKTVTGIDQPILDFTQFFHLKLGFSLSLAETSYSINFNFLAPIFFLGFKKLQIDGLLGTQLTLKLYRDNEILNAVLPQTIIVEEKINFNNNDNWLLARLSLPIDLNGKNFHYCLIKSKDDLPIVPNKKSQMAHFRVVEDVGLMKVSPLKDVLFIDWVYVH